MNLPSFAAHGVVGHIEAARRLDGLLQVRHNLARHPSSAHQLQDGLARRVGDVGAHAGNAKRRGAGVPLCGPRNPNLLISFGNFQVKRLNLVCNVNECKNNFISAERFHDHRLKIYVAEILLKMILMTWLLLHFDLFKITIIVP